MTAFPQEIPDVMPCDSCGKPITATWGKLCPKCIDCLEAMTLEDAQQEATTP